MRVPVSWLRDFTPVDLDTDELKELLDSLGLVVEGIERVGEGLDDVVVARVLEIASIPGADRIRRVTVDAGGDPLQVVCGADNFGVGDLVPLARVGAVLPGGVAVSRRRMKGVESNGMLCSGEELGLSSDGAGLLVLGTRGEPGTPLAEAFGIERDVVFDLAIETNRPDAMSIAGVARDVAARLRLPFAIPEPSLEQSGRAAAELATLEVTAVDLCPRFTVRVLSGVLVGQSPPWMARRLLLARMRPINSVVDASNYVMLELGHPNHPYDLDALSGHGVIVREADPGEVVVTLDGQQRTLGLPGQDRAAAHDCLICDASGAPIGIGGIMGGSASEISESTSRVLLETAYFTPMAIARTSKRLGLRTEASVRFERGVDPEGLDRASARFCELVGAGRAQRAYHDGAQRADHDGAQRLPGLEVAPGTLDIRGDVPGPARVRLRTAKVQSILGVELSSGEISEPLARLGFGVSRADVGTQDVVVPTFRPDTSREIDVIEEVARLYGYDRIPLRVPHTAHRGYLDGYQRERRLVRRTLVGLGMSEAWTPSLIGPGDDERAGVAGDGIEVDNPLAREESILRRSLLPGLLGAARFNLSRRQPAVALFEVGHVFWWPLAGDQLPDEKEHLGVVLAGTGAGAEQAVRAWRALAEALRLERVEMTPARRGGLHPTRTAVLAVPSTGAEIGVVGEVDPEVLEAFELTEWSARAGWLEVDLGRLREAPRRSETAAPVSRFPSSDVDLAFVVDDTTPASAVEQTLRTAGGELLEGLSLFDVYRGPATGPGSRSLTFRLRFCALDHTLNDAELSEARQRCIDAVEQSHPARLRS